ncbi:hypothetical protein AB0M28_00450 [Streptomyces sp. NPDC051940]|uniref:hypothetical protein n=1 Tax=Streptomyces sp. NPDC051940 TaxID=3155675 RepID=UPI003430CA1F
MTSVPGPARVRLGRRAAAAGTAAVSLLALLGWNASAQGADPGTPRRVGTVVSGQADGVRGARLANGDRLEVLPRGKGSPAADFRVTPAGGDASGSYAFATQDGKLQVRPTGLREPVAATEVAIDAPDEPSATTYAATYPVKLTITNADVVTGNFYVWNRTTWTAYPVESTYYSPTASVSLPPGDYVGIALHSDWQRPSYLMTRTFRVATSGVTVTFDERAAKEAAIKVSDNTSATTMDKAVWISGPNGRQAGFAGGRVYVTPFSVAGLTLHMHEMLGASGATAATPSPYLYDLTHSFKGTVPSTPVVQVATSALAKTSTTVRAPGARTQAGLQSAPRVPGDWTGVYIGGFVPAPGTVTEYITPGVAFGRGFFYGGLGYNAAERTLPAGTSPGETLGQAPFQPGLAALGGSTRRADGTVLLSERAVLADAEGRYGFDFATKNSFRLTSGGVTYAAADDLGTGDSAVSTPLPAEPAEYRLTQTVNNRTGYTRLSAMLRSEWTFPSSGSTTGGLPLIDLGLTLDGLDTRNAAPAGGQVHIAATAATRVSQTAAETVTAVEYSADDGQTWQALPVSAGEAVLTVPATAAYISLRVTAVNDEGGSLRRTITRAFAGPASPASRTVGATRISNVKVNGGSAVRLTPGALQHFYVTFTATDPAGVARAGAVLYHGSYSAPDGYLFESWAATCKPVSATTSTCTSEMAYIHPRWLLRNSLAGTWKLAAWAESADGVSYTEQLAVQSPRVLREGAVKVDATPEPVLKGRLFKVYGKLQIADWQRDVYANAAGRTLLVQYREAGTSTYRTVRTMTTDATGHVAYTATAWRDGFWRVHYPGDAGTPPLTTAGDYVDVR